MSTPNIVDSHELACPGRDDLIAALARVIGQGEAELAWTRACKTAQVRPDAWRTSPQEMIRVVNVLSKEKGLISVVSNSMWVRLQTWELLSRRQSGAAAQRNRQ